MIGCDGGYTVGYMRRIHASTCPAEHFWTIARKTPLSAASEWAHKRTAVAKPESSPDVPDSAPRFGVLRSSSAIFKGCSCLTRTRRYFCSAKPATQWPGKGERFLPNWLGLTARSAAARTSPVSLRLNHLLLLAVAVHCIPMRICALEKALFGTNCDERQALARFGDSAPVHACGFDASTDDHSGNSRECICKVAKSPLEGRSLRMIAIAVAVPFEVESSPRHVNILLHHRLCVYQSTSWMPPTAPQTLPLLI